MSKGRQIGLLYRILGLRITFENASGNSKQAGIEPTDQFTNSDFTSLACCVYELSLSQILRRQARF
jgi:hypothetical protein